MGRKKRKINAFTVVMRAERPSFACGELRIDVSGSTREIKRPVVGVLRQVTIRAHA